MDGIDMIVTDSSLSGSFRITGDLIQMLTVS